MATTPTQIHPLIDVPFTRSTDFLELADHCQNFAQTLTECDDATEKLALCGRLSACLSLLTPTLFDPIPADMVERLTVSQLPSSTPVFEADADLLAHYCQTLAQLLIGRSLSAEMESTIEDLLLGLVNYFTDTLKAPRWLQTSEGRVFLEVMIP
jgi:hypothetical protein